MINLIVAIILIVPVIAEISRLIDAGLALKNSNNDESSIKKAIDEMRVHIPLVVLTVTLDIYFFILYFTK